jgi:hypothetical protein
VPQPGPNTDEARAIAAGVVDGESDQPVAQTETATEEAGRAEA